MSHAAASRDVVLCDIADAVAVVQLNRPERHNAWTQEMEDRWLSLLVELERRRDVNVVVLTGAGTSFCPGFDAEQLASVSKGDVAVRNDRSLALQLEIGMPIVCAINGACAGIGLVQALVCDIRFASETAKLATSFSRRGTIAELSTAWLLPRIVGHSRAMDLLLSGRTVTASEALALGLVDRVHPPEALLPEALAYARELATRCAPRAMAAIKQQVYRGWDQTIAQSEALWYQLLADPARQEDLGEGVNSYLDKRPPRFAPYTGPAEA